MSQNKEQQNLTSQIEDFHRSGEFSKALEISQQALKTNPPDLKAYDARWSLMTDMLSEVNAKESVFPEVETVLRTHPESQELYYYTNMAYRRFPGDGKNVPQELFDKMLGYPGTITYLIALIGLAEKNEGNYQEWFYYERIINECTISDGPSSWYMLAYEKMLDLVEKDRSLADDEYIDELIDGLMNAHLHVCRESQRPHVWAYNNAVKNRIKLNNRLDKALETLNSAEIRLGEKEEQEWLERTNAKLENAYKENSRLRAEVYYHQERWSEAYDGLNAHTWDFQESLWARFSQETIQYIYMLGRSAEGAGNWDKAEHHYADTYFAPTPHSEARAGLKRVYQQIERSNLNSTFEDYLKETEEEYKIREEAVREHIREKLLSNRVNEKAADFRLETLDGKSYTLSDMSGKVVMLDVGASWCGPCNMAIPQLKLIYEYFSNTEDFVLWGVNDGETPEKVRESLEAHQPPWTVLLDPSREVADAYKVRAIPKFIFIDKNGYWQYSFGGCHIIDGQPLIWMIETLLSE